MSSDWDSDGSSDEKIVERILLSPEECTQLLATLAKNVDRVVEVFCNLHNETLPERNKFPEAFRLMNTWLHGIPHWLRVGALGLYILHSTLEAFASSSPPITVKPTLPKETLEDCVMFAAFFHDCARTCNGTEPQHGENGQKIWNAYAQRTSKDPAIIEQVSQAILFHENHR